MRNQPLYIGGKNSIISDGLHKYVVTKSQSLEEINIINEINSFKQLLIEFDQIKQSVDQCFYMKKSMEYFRKIDSEFDRIKNEINLKKEFFKKNNIDYHRYL